MKWSAIRKLAKNSSGPGCSTESPPDEANINQICAKSAILYWKIDPETISDLSYLKINIPDRQRIEEKNQNNFLADRTF
jgi:hypothetical protein